MYFKIKLSTDPNLNRVCQVIYTLGTALKWNNDRLKLKYLHTMFRSDKSLLPCDQVWYYATTMILIFIKTKFKMIFLICKWIMRKHMKNLYWTSTNFFLILYYGFIFLFFFGFFYTLYVKAELKLFVKMSP